jgi:hypothetical protein
VADVVSGSVSVAPAVAFFDLDGTLVVGQTTVMLVKFLRKAGVVSRTFMLLTALWFFGYKVGLIKVSEKSRETGASVFKGLTEQEVESLMSRFAKEVLVPRLHPAAAAALAEHLAEGDHVVLISAALEPAVKALSGRRRLRRDCLRDRRRSLHWRLEGSQSARGPQDPRRGGFHGALGSGSGRLLGLRRSRDRYSPAEDGGPSGGGQPSFCPARGSTEGGLADSPLMFDER